MRIELRKRNIYKYTLALFCLFWIIFITYRIIFGNPLYDISYLVNPFLVSVIVALIISLNKKMEQLEVVKVVNKFIGAIYWKPLENFYDIIIKPIPGIGDVLMYIGETSTKYNGTSRAIQFLKIFYWITDLIPKISLVFLFFLRVFLSIPVNSSFVILFFVILIGFQFLSFLLRDFSLHNLKALESILTFEKRRLNGNILEFIRLKSDQNLKHELQYYVKLYILFKNMFYQSNLYIDIKSIQSFKIIQTSIKIIYLIGFIKIFLSYNGINLLSEFYFISLYILLLIKLFDTT
jgi:hypothetical protein